MNSNTRPRYAVIGNPIGHSLSPRIHQSFAEQCGISLEYERLLAPTDGFSEAVETFFGKGGCGLNVTVPFKEQAFELAREHLSQRAEIAGAVNTLWQDNGRLHGCNTDGVGLLFDLQRLGHDPAGRRILLVGAGGAARGVLLPLLTAGCTELRIVNRRTERAHQLRNDIARCIPDFAERLTTGGLDEAGEHWDIVINATSSSLSGEAPALPERLYNANALAYDMVYGKEATPFMKQAKATGAARCEDGLGMLVGQAAASFHIWHGVLPESEPVLAQLRRELREG